MSLSRVCAHCDGTFRHTAHNKLLMAKRSGQVCDGGKDHSRVQQVHGGGEEVSEEGEVGGVQQPVLPLLPAMTRGAEQGRADKKQGFRVVCCCS